MSAPRVVILGGGFGGLYAARALSKAPVRVTLVDRRNHHVFQPLLYQVATAGLNPADIARPIRRILRRQKNAEVLLAEATSIDPDSKSVKLTDGELSYDYLIVATGAAHSYFGNGQWSDHAPGLKTIEDALDIRRRILLAYEQAERETDPGKIRDLLTFVVVGGGPTGVELAGALAEISRHALARDFRHIDPKDARCLLIEGLDRLLPTFSERASDKAKKRLEELGVEVKTNALVTSIDAGGVEAGAESIGARTVLWAAGVSASPLVASLDVPLDKAGRVLVNSDLTVPGKSDVFVIGDLAFLEQDGVAVPGVAQAAMQGGRHVARTIVRQIKGKQPEPFRYRDKGMLAAIGRGSAVADLPRLKIGGFIAWVLWLLVHIWFLIGFRNRLVVTIEWAWAYLTYERGARLITGPQDRLLPPRNSRDNSQGRLDL